VVEIVAVAAVEIVVAAVAMDMAEEEETDYNQRTIKVR
jgi:hypothetical protein